MNATVTSRTGQTANVTVTVATGKRNVTVRGVSAQLARCIAVSLQTVHAIPARLSVSVDVACADGADLGLDFPVAMFVAQAIEARA